MTYGRPGRGDIFATLARKNALRGKFVVDFSYYFVI